ncbi:MAG TPA: hypothetical protein VHX61_11435 [Rhizomicrobium sp.]|jgi:tetratricopeptide (TPR) repeat protein|nr:hypothetical protein [Rhizomicrobium sp.]
MAEEEPQSPEPTAFEPSIPEIEARNSADPDTAKLAAALMAAQIDLATMQKQHLHTQHIRDRFLLAFDFALAIGGVVVVGIIAALFWDAWSSRSVIIESFDVPASFVAQGISGKVVASELLDRLKSFQDSTRTDQEKRAVQDAWSNTIELQIPEAGISIAELEALLHRWLSRDEHITGSVVEDGGNIVFAIRGDRFAARSFAGPRGQLHALAVKAAEYVYGGSEPYLFCVYLQNQGRDQEVVEVARQSFQSASRSDKPLLLNVWANSLSNLGRYREGLDKTREALRLKPDFWMGYDGMMGVLSSLGQEEALVQTGRDMERRAWRGSWFAARVPAVYWENLDYRLEDWPAFQREIADDMAKSGGHGTGIDEEAPIDAEALVRMHDWHGADLELETTPAAGQDHFIGAQSAFVRGIIALDRGEAVQALRFFRATDALATKYSDVAADLGSPWSCWLALAETYAGVAQNADADIARGGHLVDCYRFKGDIADRRGDWPGAQKDYAAAVALAPSIPSSDQSWGEALARHGMRDAAIAKFALAHAKGPHWADPLERWGESLAAEGKLEDALTKYNQAAVAAPNWGRLYLEWGRALDRLHRHEEALEKFRRAWSLDLAPTDRASIAGCCGT